MIQCELHMVEMIILDYRIHEHHSPPPKYNPPGTVTDCIVMKDNHSGRSRGFGFVSFSTNEELDAAQDARPHRLDGRSLESKRAVPRQLRESLGLGTDFKNVNKIYCGGISDEIGKEDLHEFFSTFGEVCTLYK